MELREADALAVQVIQVRRLDHRIAMDGDVAIALIVREYKDDVRPL